jgi:uncharacterized membrane protein
MNAGQIFALVWGVLAIAFGLSLVRFRLTISRSVREDRRQRGKNVSSGSRPPMLFAIVGALFAVAGASVVVTLLLLSTGLIYSPAGD